MAKKIKGKGKLFYPDSGGTQSVLWTDIPLHAEELQSAPVVKEAGNKRETILTHAEVHSSRDFCLKKAQKPDHHEKHVKFRTGEQLSISEGSCRRGRRDTSRTRNSKTKHSELSRSLESSVIPNSTETKHTNFDHNFHLRNRYSSESGLQPYHYDQGSYLRTRHIFESGGDEPINFSVGHCTENRKYIKSGTTQPGDRSFDDHFVNRNINQRDGMRSPRLSGRKSPISKNTKEHNLSRQKQPFRHEAENRREQLSPTDNSQFGKKEYKSPNTSILKRERHARDKKLANTKMNNLDLKENSKFVSNFKTGDRSGSSGFHHSKSDASDEIETSFSEIFPPGSCSDLIPIINKTEKTSQFIFFPTCWKCARKRMRDWWRVSVCQRNLKQYLLFYIICGLVFFVCLIVSFKVNVDVMDIPLSISMVFIVCPVAMCLIERGCLLAYLECKAKEDEPDDDHRFNYHALFSGCFCCIQRIFSVQPRARKYSHKSETNTAFKHEVADVSQISPRECPQIRLVHNKNFDGFVPQNDQNSSRVVAAIVHSSQIEDPKENNYVCEHYGQNVACGCASISSDRTSAVTDVSLLPEASDGISNFEYHSEDKCARLYEKYKKHETSVSISEDNEFEHSVPKIRRKKALKLSSLDDLINEVKDCGHTKELDKAMESKMTNVVVSHSSCDEFSISGHDKESEFTDASELDNEDKLGESDVSLVYSNEAASSTDESDSSPFSTGDDVSSSIYDNNQVGECEQNDLLEKEIQAPLSLASSGDDAFIPKCIHQSDTVAKSDPAREETKSEDFSLQTPSNNDATEYEQKVSNPSEQDALVEKRPEASTPFYYISICEVCGKDILWQSFTLNGEEIMGQVKHSCEKEVKSVPPVKPPRKKSVRKKIARPSSEHDVYICEHYGQAVACGCAEIFYKRKSNTRDK